MRVGVITFHFPWNCGAALQCVALQDKLGQLGHEACVIDYAPLYHVNRYSEYKHPMYLARRAARKKGKDDAKPARVWRAAKAYANTVKSWTKHKGVADQARKFRDFEERFMNLTRRYRTLDELRANPPQLDLYIAGSDQLWNAGLTDKRFDPAYFMSFGGEGIGRITYAMGANFDGVKKPMKKLMPLIKGIDAISLREEKYLSVVEGACEQLGMQKPLHVDLDPTLLLDAGDYARYESASVCEDAPYALVYTMPGKSQEQANAAALMFGESAGVRTIDISGNPNKANKAMPDSRVCGPGEFLSYVKGASYVVTSSFHGTVFAIVYRRQFVAIPHVQTGNRVVELLEKLGLGSRVASAPEQAAGILATPVDYGACDEALPRLRSESVEYLEKSIGRFGRAGGREAGGADTGGVGA